VKNNKMIQNLTLAASLTAMSVVIDVISKNIITTSNFGLPFYAIPIALGSIVLGPIYGLIMAFVGDFIGVTLSPFAYLPFFVLAPLAWGGLPGLFLHKKYAKDKLALVIVLTYVAATLFNTMAIYIHFGRLAASATMIIRFIFAIFNSTLMYFVIRDLYERLKPLHEKFTIFEVKN
jgi:riboflavin transporter